MEDYGIDKIEDGTAETEATIEDPWHSPSSVWKILHVCNYVSCVQSCDVVGPNYKQHADLKLADQKPPQPITASKSTRKKAARKSNNNNPSLQISLERKLKKTKKNNNPLLQISLESCKCLIAVDHCKDKRIKDMMNMASELVDQPAG